MQGSRRRGGQNIQIYPFHTTLFISYIAEEPYFWSPFLSYNLYLISIVVQHQAPSVKTPFQVSTNPKKGFWKFPRSFFLIFIFQKTLGELRCEHYFSPIFLFFCLIFLNLLFISFCLIFFWIYCLVPVFEPIRSLYQNSAGIGECSIQTRDFSASHIPKFVSF